MNTVLANNQITNLMCVSVLQACTHRLNKQQVSTLKNGSGQLESLTAALKTRNISFISRLALFTINFYVIVQFVKLHDIVVQLEQVKQ